MRSLDNPELFTQAEKKVNWRSAAYDADAAYDAAAYDAVYDAAYAAADAAAAVYDAAAAADAAYAAYAYADAATEHWVGEFFNKTGEDKQTYINEVERLKDSRNNKKRGLKHEL